MSVHVDTGGPSGALWGPRPNTRVLRPLHQDLSRRRTAPAHITEVERRLSRGASFLTSHGKHEFENALSKSPRNMKNPKVGIDKEQTLFDEDLSRHRFLRSKTFFPESSTARKQTGISGPTREGSMLNPRLKSTALRMVHTEGGRVLDDEDRLTLPARRYEPAHNIHVTRTENEDQSGFTITFDVPGVKSEAPAADITIPRLVRKVRLPSETEISDDEEDGRKKKTTSKDTGSFGAAGKRITDPKRKSSKKTKIQSLHWADDVTVSSEDETDRKDRIRDTNNLYIHMFGFSVLKKARGGKESRMGKRKSIKDMATLQLKHDAKPTLETITDEALEKAEADKYMMQQRESLLQEEEHPLPALACPSSELKSRQIRVSLWMSGNALLRPTSRTLLPLV